MFICALSRLGLFFIFSEQGHGDSTPLHNVVNSQHYYTRYDKKMFPLRSASGSDDVMIVKKIIIKTGIGSHGNISH